MSQFLADTFSWLGPLGQAIAGSPWSIVALVVAVAVAWAVA